MINQIDTKFIAFKMSFAERGDEKLLTSLAACSIKIEAASEKEVDKVVADLRLLGLPLVRFSLRKMLKESQLSELIKEATEALKSRGGKSPLILTNFTELVQLLRSDENLRKVFSEAEIVQMLNNLREELEIKGAKSFMELIPLASQDKVRELIEEAYPTKGEGRSREEFSENFALSWLLRMIIFKQLVRKGRFVETGLVERSENVHIAALTENGSFVFLSTPNGGGLRNVLYTRIPDRQNESIPPVLSGKGELNQDALMRFPLAFRVGGNTTTSKLIFLAKGRELENEFNPREFTTRLAGAYGTIGKHTGI